MLLETACRSCRDLVGQLSAVVPHEALQETPSVCYIDAVKPPSTVMMRPLT